MSARNAALAAVLAIALPACQPGPGGSGPQAAPAPVTVSFSPAPSPDATSSPQPSPQQPAPSPTAADPEAGESDGVVPPADEGSPPRAEPEPAGPSAALKPGQSNARVLELQQRLRDLRYWVGEPDGVYGDLTAQAVMAFESAEGLPRDGVAGKQELDRLADAEVVTARNATGDVIEVDERRQLLIFIDDGQVRWVFHTSTGTEKPYEAPGGGTNLADTPNGRWTMSWQVNGWRDGALGRMWSPKYFHSDGIAIHGYPSVPAEPASHGCVRVSIEAMDFIWEHDLAPIGSEVHVFGRGTA